MGQTTTRGFEGRKKTEYPLSKPIIVTKDNKVYAKDPSLTFKSQSTKFTHEPSEDVQVATKKKKKLDYQIHYKISNEHPIYGIENSYSNKKARFLLTPSHNMRASKACVYFYTINYKFLLLFYAMNKLTLE